MTNLGAIRVDPTNKDQATAWDGAEGAFWAEHAEEFDASLARYQDRFLAAADIGPDSQVLDVGCGTGGSSLDAGRLARSGGVLGVDLSARMLAVARAAAERAGLTHVRFEQADAQIHSFPEAFYDVAISRTAAMFFGDPAAAFANIARALRPGGTLVLLVWQALPRNEWIATIAGALAAGRDLPPPPADRPGPFTMAEPDRVRGLLTGAGFTDVRLEGLEEPMYFGADPAGAQEFVLGVAGWMLDGLDDATRAGALADLHQALEAHDTGQGVLLRSATWLVTARRAG
jgi:SAM-dependent methyltransferase